MIEPERMNNDQLRGVCCEGGLEGTDYEDELERRLDEGETAKKSLEQALEWLGDGNCGICWANNCGLNCIHIDDGDWINCKECWKTFLEKEEV